MQVIFLYADENGQPKQHIADVPGEAGDFTIDGFDLSDLPDRNEGGCTFAVVMDDPTRPTVLDCESGDEVGATFG